MLTHNNCAILTAQLLGNPGIVILAAGHQHQTHCAFMPPFQPQLQATAPPGSANIDEQATLPALKIQSQHQQDTDVVEGGCATGAESPGPRQSKDAPVVKDTFQARELLRLFQCSICSKPLTEPVTLPCGSTICKACIPRPHVRRSISYPAREDRLEGFQCPLPTCTKEHTLGDCGTDVVLNKLTDHVRSEMRRRRLTPPVLPGSLTASTTTESYSSTPQPREQKPADTIKAYASDALAHIWELAEKGSLTEGTSESDISELDSVVEEDSMTELQKVTRPEVDCQVCYSLFYDPLTTGCGHTFCRTCLHRILDHSRCCPICRRQLAISPLLSRFACPSNRGLAKIIETLWKDELTVRRDTITADEAAQENDLNTPLFVCTLAFPRMPTFLHVFEPQYRLMIRRVMEGNKTFGMVLPRRQRAPGDTEFCKFGTLLRIENAHFYPDGRCLIESVGLSRFRVLRHAHSDGYVVSKVERVDDIGLQEEEATEAAEVANTTQPYTDDNTNNTTRDQDQSSITSRQSTGHPFYTTVASLDMMATRDLMAYATTFVARMQSQSVPWMAAQVLAIYGECPYEDPAVFPWWLASVLPIKDSEKYKLLESSSVRQRLKICCKWIVEWESRSW